MGNVDLHIHSYYSDGSMSPEQIADFAAQRGVTTLAIADHDMIQGSVALKPLCAARGIRHIPAVEHCANHQDLHVHVLSYFADFENAAYLSMIRRARKALDDMSITLIERMQPHEPRVTVESYMGFTRNPALGGWACLEYLMHCGVTQSMTAGMPYYPRYGISYADADFPSLKETIDTIHRAGGVAILAHPAETLRPALQSAPEQAQKQLFCRALEALMGEGFDGIECYYPLHEDWVTQACLDLCEARGLMVTSGSDSHGIFGNTREIGAMNVDESQVRLHVE